ncbi:MAG: hypothetical protein RLZ98_520 [Pseudomonadota bacterium]
MKITRLRLIGFKSFVEPTELLIEAGLTGVVGPNGCGKSNLLEALRWVMGETSYKSMRAASMDDVIFSGTTQRPARNAAEVTIFVDNQLRTAPAEFNEADVIEITRRIERESGSDYRVNGKDVRARDIKILFEDAATGARSPALVRQGQIAELVNAKPEQRRRVLEDAAGIAGLHTRRHEAELRLRAAEGNLERLDDVLGQMNSQMEQLKRQARQARRYKDISGDIRRAEAIVLHLGWQLAQQAVCDEESALAEALALQGSATEAEAKAIRGEAEAAEALQPLRQAEAERAAAVARIRIEHANLEREAERARERADELTRRMEQIGADLVREKARQAEGSEALAALAEERRRHEEAEAQALAQAVDLKEITRRAEEDVGAAEAAYAKLTEEAIAEKARRNALVQRQNEIAGRRRQLEQRLAVLERDIGLLAERRPAEANLLAAQDAVAQNENSIASLELDLSTSESGLEEAQSASRATRQAAQAQELAARQLETEVSTLEKLLATEASAGFPPVLDTIAVQPGYEVALAAALGDDLDASLDRAAPTRWLQPGEATNDPELPDEAEPLSKHVSAPPELHRRLQQIGLVGQNDLGALQARLKPGQRLVTLRGDLCRWDGYAASGETPTAAAQRLAERNRLASIRIDAQTARKKALELAEADEAAQQAHATIEARVRSLRQALRETHAVSATARKNLAELELREREYEQKSEAMSGQRTETLSALNEVEQLARDVEAQAGALKDPATYEPELNSKRAVLDLSRAHLLEQRSMLASIERERTIRADRLDAIAIERRRLENNQAQASQQIATLEARGAETERELATACDIPQRLEDDRQRLMSEVEAGEAARRAAADRLAEAEELQRQSAQTVRAVQAELAASREARVRREARLEAARDRRTEETRKIEEAFGVAPDQCLASAGLDPAQELPPLDDVERRLQRLKADRERLGGVNLAADDELQSLATQVEGMVREREDVEAAVAKLRAAIGKLNREGKQRLEEAFNSVNTHFQDLFTTLFGGGEARLEMIEGEDPLQGGLEIIAKPPGKKPTTLSLLSGGEQTLTALSLIFAVFLTNPSPICVLDEVDAPLDDANVDRFCTLMEKMAADTETRFLVITHHPMTMARMNRLFGVTMAEKGVSQLVSVDLATAERFAEAS